MSKTSPVYFFKADAHCILNQIWTIKKSPCCWKFLQMTHCKFHKLLAIYCNALPIFQMALTDKFSQVALKREFLVQQKEYKPYNWTGTSTKCELLRFSKYFEIFNISWLRPSHHREINWAYLILVSTATTGGGVLFSSWYLFHRERDKDCFQQSLFREYKHKSTHL